MTNEKRLSESTEFKLLSEADPLLRQFLECSPDATLIVSRQGMIVFANSQAQEMFGFKEQELIGSPLTLLIPDRFHRVHGQHEASFFKNPSRRTMGRETELELVARRHDNSEFPVDISLSPLQSTEGIWVAAAVRDVTARKQAERKIQEYAEELKRSNEELESFAHVAAHDLGAPLRRVGMVSKMIQDEYGGKLDESIDNLFDVLIRSVRQMEDLIQELLTHSKVGAQSLDFQPVDIADVIDKVLLDFADAIEEQGISIKCGELPTVAGDRVSLVRLFQNLIGNAIAYRSNRPLEICINAVQRGATWEFQVADNGIGIDPKNHDKIFQIFQRLHDDSVAGTGIGLATCKKIAELHGGHIWVESEPQRGSTFHFTIANGSS